MLSSILYKEYIKTHKIIFFFGILILYSLFQTFIDAKNSIELYDPVSVILGITQMGRFDFNNIYYFCTIFAIVLGIAQFYPEVNQARIRLYLHLPMSHFKLVSIIVFSGLFLLGFFFLVITLVYKLILTSYYPAEVFDALFSKLFPMFLSSILFYLATIVGFLEPQLRRKLFYVALAFIWGFVLLSLSKGAYFSSFMINNALIILIAVYILTVYEVITAYTKGYIKWKA